MDDKSLYLVQFHRRLAFRCVHRRKRRSDVAQNEMWEYLPEAEGNGIDLTQADADDIPF